MWWRKQIAKFILYFMKRKWCKVHSMSLMLRTLMKCEKSAEYWMGVRFMVLNKKKIKSGLYFRYEWWISASSQGGKLH